MVKVFELLSYRHIFEQFRRLCNGKVRDVAPALKHVGQRKVFLQLSVPGKIIGSLFTELELTKPRRYQRTSRAGFEDNSFEPLESSDSEFELHREYANFLKHLHIADGSMFVVRVN